MAQIGNLGKLIVFAVSSDKVLTFDRLQQSVKARWTAHNRIKRKPVYEFLGADARTLSLQIKLNTNLGIKPRDTLTKIENAVEKGKTYPLVIGGKKVGKNEWAITDISETWDVVMSQGELISCALTLNLVEYIGG